MKCQNWHYDKSVSELTLQKTECQNWHYDYNMAECHRDMMNACVSADSDIVLSDVVTLTGPTLSMMTSLTSSHPSRERTSNNANIALPMLSKLKLRGFALKYISCIMTVATTTVTMAYQMNVKSLSMISHQSILKRNNILKIPIFILYIKANKKILSREIGAKT